jgi:hypothetical protein
MYQFGPMLPTQASSDPHHRVLVNAPDPVAAKTIAKAPPPGVIAKPLPAKLPLSGDYNHIHALSAAQVADIAARTGLRDIVSRDGAFTGLISTARGDYQVTFEDGVLASGRQVIAFGADKVGPSAAHASQLGGLVTNVAAATQLHGAVLLRDC